MRQARVDFRRAAARRSRGAGDSGHGARDCRRACANRARFAKASSSSIEMIMMLAYKMVAKLDAGGARRCWLPCLLMAFIRHCRHVAVDSALIFAASQASRQVSTPASRARSKNCFSRSFAARTPGFDAEAPLIGLTLPPHMPISRERLLFTCLHTGRNAAPIAVGFGY